MTQPPERGQRKDERGANFGQGRLSRLGARAYLKMSDILFRLGLVIPLYRLVHKPLQFLISRMVPNPATVDGVLMYHDICIEGAIIHMMAGVYEPGTSMRIKRLLQAGMTFVDIGAHCGYFTLMAARQVGPQGQVYAFEPDPRNIPLLQKNVAANKYEGWVKILPLAIANASRGNSVEFFLNESSGQSTLFGAPAQRRITVSATTLDKFFAGTGWPPVDLIKVDAEGAELEVLAGMAQLSLRNPALSLILEYSPTQLESQSIPPLEMFSSLNHLGFTRITPLVEHQHQPYATWSPDAGFEALIRQIGDGYCNLLCEKGPNANGV